MYTPAKLVSSLLATGAVISLVVGMQQRGHSHAAPAAIDRARVASVTSNSSRTAADVRRASGAGEAEVPALNVSPGAAWTPPVPAPAEDADASAPDADADTESTANAAAAPPEPSWGPLSTISRLLAAVGMGGGTAAAAPSTGSQSPATPTSLPQGARNISFGDSQTGACQSAAETFVLNFVREVYVCVSWPVLTGTHELDLTFISPDGNAYQTMQVPFVTADAAELESTPPDIQRAGVGSGGEARVVTALPVAGTHIHRYKMVGVWTVRVSVDGQSHDSDRFTLSSPQ
jgi:hypothetical protein